MQIDVAVITRVTGQLAELNLVLVIDTGSDAPGRLRDRGDVDVKSRPVHELKVPPACDSTTVTHAGRPAPEVVGNSGSENALRQKVRPSPSLPLVTAVQVWCARRDSNP